MKLLSCLIFTIILLLCGCSNNQEEILVFACAGTRIPMEKCAKDFQEQTGINVKIIYEGTGHLIGKIQAGQRPHIFLAGSDSYIKSLVDYKLPFQSFNYVYHIPVFLLHPSLKKIQTIEELLFKKDLKWVFGDPNAAAIGKPTIKILNDYQTKKDTLNIVANGITVKQLVTWVESGNADASIVWHADAFASSGRLLPIPKDKAHASKIPLIFFPNKKNSNASKFVKYLQTKGLEIFKKNGFKAVERT
jgi:molybdate transport system substrate-binding protein